MKDNDTILHQHVNPSDLTHPCPFCNQNDDIYIMQFNYVKNAEFRLHCLCGLSYGGIGYNAVKGDPNKAYRSLIKQW